MGQQAHQLSKSNIAFVFFFFSIETNRTCIRLLKDKYNLPFDSIKENFQESLFSELVFKCLNIFT